MTDHQEATMRMWSVGICITLAAVPLPEHGAVAQQASAEPMAQARQAIDAQNRAWADATVRGDAAAIARIFADSGTEVSVRAGRIWKGRQAIQDLFTEIYRDPHATDAVVETEQVILDGPTAVEYGHYRFTYPSTDGQPRVESGKYVVVWRRDGDGAWRILMDMGVPAPAAAP
jgi:uncharacterized protein (TIGR02246 family)